MLPICIARFVFSVETGDNADGGKYSRKNSSLQMDIENTLKKITGAPVTDPLTEDISPPGLLPQPLAPTPAKAQAPSPPGGTQKPSLPRKPSVDMSTKPPSMEKTEDDVGQKPKARTGSYKVLKIDNIPDKPKEKVEMRYLGAAANTVHENIEKKLSYVSSEDRHKDLKAKKAMFEGNVGATQALQVAKSNVTDQKSVDMNSNSVIHDKPKVDAKTAVGEKTGPSKNKQQDGKFVTVLTVGGEQQKTSLNRTISTPQQPVSQSQTPVGTKAKTLPGKVARPYLDQPQSSIPPDMIPPSSDSVYSLAKDPDPLQSIPSYYSSEQLGNAAALQTGRTAMGNNPAQDPYSYSLLSNNSSAIDGNSGTPSSFVYSYSTVPGGMNDADRQSGTNLTDGDMALYAAVEKSNEGMAREVSNDYVCVVNKNGNSSQVNS